MEKQKNRIAVIFLCFILPVITGLACLQPANQVATDPSATPAPKAKNTTAPAAALIQPAASAVATPGCVVISADEALHMRQDPGSEAQVLAFMKSGEVVKLISTRNPAWWLIKRGDLVGYARSRYLQAAQCR